MGAARRAAVVGVEGAGKCRWKGGKKVFGVAGRRRGNLSRSFYSLGAGKMRDWLGGLYSVGLTVKSDSENA